MWKVIQNNTKDTKSMFNKTRNLEMDSYHYANLCGSFLIINLIFITIPIAALLYTSQIDLVLTVVFMGFFIVLHLLFTAREVMYPGI